MFFKSAVRNQVKSVASLVLSLGCYSSLLYANDKPGHLQIILMPSTSQQGASNPKTTQDTSKQDQEKKQGTGAAIANAITDNIVTAFFDKNSWLGACNMLGNTLLVGKGPWGFGAFNSFSCYYGKELQSGSRDSSDFVVRMSDDAKGLHITVEHGVGNKPKAILNQIDLPPAAKSYSYFSDPDLADLTAYAILDSLPGMMYLTKTEKSGTSVAIVGRKSRENAKFLIPNPPDNMNVLEYEYDSKKSKFKEIPVSNMNFLGYRIPGKEEQSKILGREVVTPLWTLDQKAEAAILKSPLWAHNLLGAGSRKAELNKLVDSAYRFLALGTAPEGNLLTGAGNDVTDQNFRTNLMKGTVVARLGLSLVKEPALLRKTKVFGLVAETRPRGYGGFRFYYDTVPSVSEKVPVEGVPQKSEFTWSRVALGWAFGFDIQRFSRGIFDYIDISPKASIWNLTSSLSLDSDDGSGEITTFKVSNDPSIGWELGLEKTISKVLLRGWYGADFLGLLSSIEKDTSVKIHRFGLDTWIAGPQFSVKTLMRTSFLAFFWYESVDLSKKGSDENREYGIYGINVRFAYLGAGAGIQW